MDGWDLRVVLMCGRNAQGKHIKTPALVGTILPGVTRNSILKLAVDMGYTVEETNVAVKEALQADEVFTSGAVRLRASDTKGRRDER